MAQKVSYSIKDLEKLSGIKAHTIRIWEQRYSLLNPERSETNIRSYSENDLKMLLNVSCLNKNGFKISKIASLTKEEISKKVWDINNQEAFDPSSEINQFIVCMIELDEDRFKSLMAKSIQSMGVAAMFEQLIYPFLEKIGLLWQIGTINPAHEHFISNLIRDLLIIETAKLGEQTTTQKRCLLFLPENERHEIGLLLYNFHLRKNGHQTFYLGADVPEEDLIKTIETVQPDITVCAFVNPLPKKELNTYMDKLCQGFEHLRHFCGGQQAKEHLSLKKSNLTLIKTLEDLSFI